MLDINNKQKALETIYNRTYAKAYVIAKQILKNEEDVLDVLQEVYISVFNHMETLKDDSKLDKWVNMIVANKCKDWLRKKKVVLFSDMGEEAEDDYVATIEDDNLEFLPEESVDYAETKRLMAEILDALPEDQRMCILMYYYDELSVNEIAESLACSTGTVKSRLNYARKKIKEEVEALEKKGTKLYGIAPLPFLVWMLKEEAYAVVPKTLCDEIILNVSMEMTKAVKGATTSGVKAVSVKAIVSMVVAVAVIGGGMFAHSQNNKNDGEEGTVASVEESVHTTKIDVLEEVMNRVDKELVENLLYYLPAFDEKNPISPEEMVCLVQDATVKKLHNMANGADEPTPLISDEGIEIDEGDLLEQGDGFSNSANAPYIRVPYENFYEMAEVVGYDYKVDDLRMVDPDFGESFYFDWEIDHFAYVDYYVGGIPWADRTESSMNVDVAWKNAKCVEDVVEIPFELTYSYKYINQNLPETVYTSNRTVRIKLTEQAYEIVGISQEEGSTAPSMLDWGMGYWQEGVWSERNTNTELIGELSAEDKAMIESLMCYLPIYGEGDPISDTEMYTLIQYSMVHKYVEKKLGMEWPESQLPTTLIDDKGIEMGKGNMPILGEYLEDGTYIKADATLFNEIANTVGFGENIDEQFLNNTDSVYQSIKWLDGSLVVSTDGLDSRYDWELRPYWEYAKVTDNIIKVEYYLSYSDDSTETSNNRVAEIEVSDEGYKIKSITAEFNGDISIVDMYNYLDKDEQKNEMASTHQDKIEYIRNIYYSVQDNINNYSKEGIEGLYWRYLDDNRRIHKITLHPNQSEFPDGENVEDYVVEYYYDVSGEYGAKLVFAFVVNKRTGEEHRFYQYDSQLIRYIDSKKKTYDNESNIDVSSTEYMLYVNGTLEILRAYGH